MKGQRLQGNLVNVNLTCVQCLWHRCYGFEQLKQETGITLFDAT